MPVSDFEFFGSVQIKAALSDLMSDTLATIDDEKSNDIVTPDILRYGYGITLVEGEYPAMSIMGLREHVVRDEEEWRLSQFVYDIEVYCVGDDPETLEKYCNRYGRAVKDALWDKYKTIGVIESIEYPPILTRGTALYKGVAVIFKLLVRENRSD